MSTLRAVPHAHIQTITAVRDRARACSDALAAHARDVMASGEDLDALARVQMVRAHVDAAVIALEQALKEGSG